MPVANRTKSWKRLSPRRLRGPAHRTVRRAFLRAPALLLRRRRPAGPGERLRIRVLLQHAHGTGGTIRTVLNLCGYLAAHHDVEIVSVVRTAADPFYPIPPGVTVRFADDRTAPRGRAARLLARLPSLLTPHEENSFHRMNLWTDLCLLRALAAGPPPDVLVGTRPSLNLLIAALAPPGTVTIGQDHLNLGSYRPGLRRLIARSYGRLTVVAALTEAGRAEFAASLAGAPVRVVAIPNALPELPGGPSPRDRKVILAAGRLTRQKGFDLLVRAYAPLAAEHPDWTLRILGSGARHDRLSKQIAEAGLDGRIRLLPRTPDLAGEMGRASVYALSSRKEGMPMVLLEAMDKGLAVVAFDCPTGPAELITDGADGLLVPAGDVAALTAALRAVITDAALRDRLGEQARETARGYHMDRVGPAWLRLLAEPAGGPPPPAATFGDRSQRDRSRTL
ncbi:glycosyltransferase family 4 protein [Actinomadura macrotermitis]|uniref:GalNAc-alpha-(1->4)-GalNAc-alpha-(1->3)-diNAcBac-PP-undecaprenol alpha-1,4-N-acetyl-D-galactosaminyltransferase n=1 Tax=Actinomadura macrotermitis TaxID=2585200 RepID=A0A7K0C7T4_9ACTN|nr:glycosyltransferase family 4 protein [Actinomadura macrotermitis]MQY09172.1 GalNAc-alpha-(1->4)-GalNAc-alpha-(1->3)-diNAcBac-PP-undecaprenol alpha-1,4-N-acetyl-D-galactosaminyltransferase [Actinomadura macrotermitis]